MNKFKTLDGYDVYSITIENTIYYLADNKSYQEDIKRLLNTLDDLKFDSLILIFGLDTGSYIEQLVNVLCERNRVIIFEPNEEIFIESQNIQFDSRIKVIKFDTNKMRKILGLLIGLDNFDNLYVHAFGNYADIYQEEYTSFIKIIDSKYISQSGNIALSFRCNESFMKNQISNLSIIDGSSPLNPHVFTNRDVPAFIISAGPSLDKNIEDMVRNIDLLKKGVVIAANRTFSTLIKNGIKPDVVISIDPSDAMLDMMKDNLNSDVPLAFCENTNRYLTANYKGPKIYISTVLNKVIKEMNVYWNLLHGGSVAHSCISFADMLGCNPIILVGQDFAYTFDKHHSEDATFAVDNTANHNANKVIKDVYGNDINTSITLNLFKENMELHIEEYKKHRDVEFINVSYGADILGAPHKELSVVFNDTNFNTEKKSLSFTSLINLNPKEIIDSIFKYIDEYIIKSEQGIEQCEIISNVDESKSLINSDSNDIDFQRFLFILDIVNTFEQSLENFYLGGYFYKFIFIIKRECFRMLAKDYSTLTSNMKYQGKAFLKYFTRMNTMLTEARKIIEETLEEQENEILNKTYN